MPNAGDGTGVLALDWLRKGIGLRWLDRAIGTSVMGAVSSASTLRCIEWFTIYLEAFAVVPIVFQLWSILQKVCLRMFFSPKNKIRVVRYRYWVKTIPMWQNSWTIWPCYVKTKENMTRYAELHPYWKDAVLRPWQTRAHCCGHTVADTNVSPFARAPNICCGHKFCVGDKKCFWFCSETFCVLNKYFPVCAAQETSWATMCPQHCVLVYQGLYSYFPETKLDNVPLWRCRAFPIYFSNSNEKISFTVLLSTPNFGNMRTFK